MKTKIITSMIIVSVLTAPATLLAQDLEKQGTKEAGGSIMFSSQSAMSGPSSSHTTNLNTFAFDPFVGFIFKGGFELGVQAQYLEQSYGSLSQSVFGLYLAPGINIG